MKALKSVEESISSIDWFNYDSLPGGDCKKVEIYLESSSKAVEDMTLMFYFLFGRNRNNLIINNRGEWGDFCLDTWDHNSNSYNYNLENKTRETQVYLKMLQESEIEMNYNGDCKCLDWGFFLKTILQCIINHVAPYSPFIYNLKSNYIFYFHHTHSIGLYYYDKNEEIKEILDKASNEYLIKHII